MSKNKMKKNLGFTLIELLVVISIIGFLATLALVSLNSARVKARDARRLSDISQLRKAIQLYADDHQGVYPAGNYGSPGFGGLAAMLSPYLSKMPDDPSGTVYGPNVWRFYYYWDSANFTSWGWGQAGCDGKRVVFSLGVEGGQTVHDCPMPGVADLDILVIN